MDKALRFGVLWLALALAWGCERKDEQEAEPAAEAVTEEAPKPKHGVDPGAKKVTIGVLNDQSGPAATIGRPYALGKEILVQAVNGGDVKILPEGWTLELVSKDHAYNPQQSVQQFNAIKNDVLFIATSFGTPTTLPLVDMLKRDNLVAFPASLSSEMAKHRHTPPLGPSYKVEAMRAMDWAVEHAGGADDIKAGIVYQQDDYGKDGLDGLRQAAERHGIEVVSEQPIAPGQADVTAAVKALQDKGANYVLLTTLPSTTGPVLGTAAQLKYAPVWIGNTPAWIDAFFDPKTIPAAVFQNFHWVTGLTYWGEEGVDGMDEFLKVYEKYGKDKASPDYYILASYGQGLIELEALRRAIEAGPVTRDSYLKALTSIDGYDARGLFQEVSLTAFPYQTSDQTRILKPKLEERTWEEVAPFDAPKADAAAD
jgi:ABC-type branched-subunit amino acid transport system substrate-binding protein